MQYVHPSKIDQPPRDRRCMLVALDGATFDALEPLAAAGVMPCLAGLLKRTVPRTLLSTLPSVTPVAWSTLLSGCDPAQHGVWDFRRFDHPSGVLRLHRADGHERPSLLAQVSAAGGSIVSIDAPLTWPVPAGVRGIVLGGFDSPSRQVTLAAYPELARRLANRDIALDLETVWKRRPRTRSELEAGVWLTQRNFRDRAAAAMICDEFVDWRLMVVQFQALDALQHRCWDLLGLADLGGHAVESTAPAGREKVNATWIAGVRNALKSLDECLERLCELAARRGASVTVVSDHGFGSFRGEIHTNEILRRAGLHAATGWGQRGWNWGHRAAWKIGRWSRRQRNPAGSLASLPRPLATVCPGDLQRSQATSLHGDLGALIYLHSPQRFRTGPVRTTRQAAQVRADVQGALLTARNPSDQQPLFTAVWDLGDRFDVDPLERMWPDLVALPADGFHTVSRAARGQATVSANFEMAATHRREGILLAEREFLAALSPQPELRDIAPVILGRLGVGPQQPTAWRYSEFGEQDTAIVERRLAALGYLG